MLYQLSCLGMLGMHVHVHAVYTSCWSVPAYQVAGFHTGFYVRWWGKHLIDKGLIQGFQLPPQAYDTINNPSPALPNVPPQVSTIINFAPSRTHV